MAPNSLTVATSYNNIGGVLQQQGKLEDALEQYRRALAIEEEKAPNSLKIATSYYNIAAVYRKEGQTAMSFSYLDRSHSILESRSIVAWHRSQIQCK